LSIAYSVFNEALCCHTKRLRRGAFSYMGRSVPEFPRCSIQEQGRRQSTPPVKVVRLSPRRGIVECRPVRYGHVVLPRNLHVPVFALHGEKLRMQSPVSPGVAVMSCSLHQIKAPSSHCALVPFLSHLNPPLTKTKAPLLPSPPSKACPKPPQTPPNTPTPSIPPSPRHYHFASFLPRNPFKTPTCISKLPNHPSNLPSTSSLRSPIFA